MLDKLDSETGSDIKNLLEDSDTEYIAEEPIPDSKEKSHQLLTPKATVHVEGEVLDIDEPPAKKLKKKVAELKRTSKFVKLKKVHTRSKRIIRHSQNANSLLKFEGTTNNLNEIVKQIWDQTNQWEFATNPEEIRTFLGVNHIM